MISVAGFQIRFTLSWLMLTLAIVGVLFFSRLGFWQLQRADEKKKMLVSEQMFAKQTPIQWTPTLSLPQQYQQIIIGGHFLPNVFLLDNQHYQHQFGYHVISPLRLANGRVVLVDRGWLKADMTRQVLPETTTPSGLVNITGSAYYPSAKNWLLGKLLEKEQSNVAVVELIDTQMLSQFLHKSVYPFIIRLSKQSAHGYVREWAIVSMPPERHYAYALQWFAIALLVLVLFFARNIEIKKKT